MTDNGFTIRKMKNPSIMKKENFGIMNKEGLIRNLENIVVTSPIFNIKIELQVYKPDLPNIFWCQRRKSFY